MRKTFFQDANYVDTSSTTRSGGTHTSTKDDKQRLKELEKQHGEYLLRIKTNALSAYIGAVAQILGAPDSPVWQNALVPMRCIGCTVQGNVVHYDLKGPRDVPATIVLTYVQLGEWVDVFWDLQGFKHAVGTARKGFGLNYADNMKNAHLQCEADLARNPAPVGELGQEMPSTQVPSGKLDEKDKALSAGIELMQKGQHAAAVKYFDKAIQIDPRDTQSYWFKATVCVQAQRFQEALEAANHGLQLNPKEESNLTVKAMALMKLGKSGEALKTFDEIPKLHPESKQAWMNLANFYTGMMEGRVGGAATDMLIINALEKAVTLDPSDVQPMARLALLYEKYNDYVSALRNLEHVAAVNPDPKIQAYVIEIKQKIAQGLSHPFIETLKKEAIAAGATIKETVPVSGSEKICPKCGEKLPPNAKFCNKCGQKMV